MILLSNIDNLQNVFIKDNLAIWQLVFINILYLLQLKQE